MDDLTGLRRDLRGLAVDLAAVRVAAAVARYLDGRKYDPHPMRQPAGAQVNGHGAGGQFAPKSGAAAGLNALRSGVAQAARAEGNSEALAAAGPGATAVAAGGVAVSRQAGLYAHYASGQAITPILGLPGGKLEIGPAPFVMGPQERAARRIQIGKFADDCEVQEKKELAYCARIARPYGGRLTQMGRKVFAICASTAATRLGECYRNGASGMTTPRY